jgi:hypothetical protein
MKRLSFITACLLAAILTAQAQDYYAEEYIKSSGKLSAKIYVSHSNGISKR